jgi:hypothetical protein
MDIELVLGIGAGLFYAVVHAVTPAWRYRRKLRRAPLRPIAEVEEDRVARIVGIVRAVGPTIVSPLLGKPCVCFVVVARKNDSVNDGVIARQMDAVPFVIEDSSGHALVVATEAQLAITMWHVAANQPVRALDEPARALVRDAGLGDTTRVDVEEGVIAVGDRIAVLGSGTREPDPDAAGEADYRSAGGTRLCLTSSRKYPLVISNQPDTLR